MAKRAAPVKPDNAAEIAKLERDLQTVTGRYSTAAKALDKAAVERDRVIRDAHAAGMTPTAIAAKTELTTARVDQIRRGARL